MLEDCKLQIVAHRHINACLKQWTDIIAHNHYYSPFQYPEISDILFRNYYPFMFVQREFPVFYELIQNGKTVMIAPMCHKYCSDGMMYTSFGSAPTIATQDFIYRENIKKELMADCLNFLFERFRDHKVRFNNLREDSLLYNVLAEKYAITDSHANVAIPIPGDYQLYYDSLSKNTRQNIRTAYNRLNRDNKQYNLELTQGAMAHKEQLSIMQIYIKRRINRYRKTGLLHRVFLRKIHFNTIGFQKLDYSFSSVLRIDNTIAAFLQGYMKNDKSSVIVPRLSINEDCVFYSPGMLLLNETVKEMAKRGIGELDLSKGAETYKYAMGGRDYFTYDIEICL